MSDIQSKYISGGKRLGVFARLSSLVSAIGLMSVAPFCVSAAQADVRIVALGDSQIRGKGVFDSQTYPRQLEAALRARGHKVTVTNEGINGDTTAMVIQRIDKSVPPGTDIVVLSVGGNDIILRHFTQEYVNAQEQEIVRLLKAKGAEVYVVHHMQEGMVKNVAMHVETVRTPGTTEWHLNQAGYAVVVQRTIPAIEVLVRKVEKRKPN